MRFDIERYLRVRSARTPSFSPDGRKIAYITETTGVPQVWSVDLEHPWPEQLSFTTERVGQARYSPSSGHIVFSTDAGGNERMQIFLLREDGSTCEDLTADPECIHSFGGWSPDGKSIAFSSNKRNRMFFDVYIMDVNTRESRLVFQHDSTNHVACWTPDSQGLIIRRSVSNMDQDLYYLDLTTGESKHLTPHQGEATFRSLVPFPSGRRFYLVTNHGKEFSGLATLDLDGNLEYLITPDWNVESIDLSPGGRFLAYTVNRAGYSDLHVMDAGKRADVKIPPIPAGIVSGLTWAPAGRKLAFTFSGSTYNADIWVLDLDSFTVEQVTFSSRAGIPQETFVEPEPVMYPTFDGRSIAAFFYKPHVSVSSDRGLPVIVHVHGGPEGQTRPGFNSIIQYLCNRGYAVFAPNVRGSSGYGREFIHLDDVRKRMDSVKDLAYGAQWLRGQEDVDPSKIAVMGASYGGFMVLAAVTAYPEFWAAGVDIVGIANIETFLQNTGSWRRRLREPEYGSLEKDVDFFREISPIYHVDKIRCPLMVVHGKNDPRVPFGEAVQIVEKLQERGGTVEPVFFDDEGHGIVKLHNRLVAYRKIADFLDKYVAN